MCTCVSAPSHSPSITGLINSDPIYVVGGALESAPSSCPTTSPKRFFSCLYTLRSLSALFFQVSPNRPITLKSCRSLSHRLILVIEHRRRHPCLLSQCRPSTSDPIPPPSPVSSVSSSPSHCPAMSSVVSEAPRSLRCGEKFFVPSYRSQGPFQAFLASFLAIAGGRVR